MSTPAGSAPDIKQVAKLVKKEENQQRLSTRAEIDTMNAAERAGLVGRVAMPGMPHQLTATGREALKQAQAQGRSPSPSRSRSASPAGSDVSDTPTEPMPSNIGGRPVSPPPLPPSIGGRKVAPPPPPITGKAPPPRPSTVPARPAALKARAILPRTVVNEVMNKLEGVGSGRTFAVQWNTAVDKIIQQAADAAKPTRKGLKKDKSPVEMANILKENISVFRDAIKTVFEQALIARVGEVQAKSPKPSLEEIKSSLSRSLKSANLKSTLVTSMVDLFAAHVGGSPTEKQIAAYNALAESIAGNVMRDIPTQAAALGIDHLAGEI